MSTSETIASVFTSIHRHRSVINENAGKVDNFVTETDKQNLTHTFYRTTLAAQKGDTAISRLRKAKSRP